MFSLLNSLYGVYEHRLNRTCVASMHFPCYLCRYASTQNVSLHQRIISGHAAVDGGRLRVLEDFKNRALSQQKALEDTLDKERAAWQVGVCTART